MEKLLFYIRDRLLNRKSSKQIEAIESISQITHTTRVRTVMFMCCFPPAASCIFTCINTLHLPRKMTQFHSK